jgi:murein DD-endopeptidase MepM/ murein hydrolase activator NlpD
MSPAEVEATIRRVAGEYRFPSADLLVATARQESSLNPFAIGDSGASAGPFQEHERGRGAGLSVAQRQDVGAATERAIREFAQVRQRFPDADPGTWAARAQRPADPTGYAQKVNQLLGQGAPVGTAALAPVVSTAAPDWYRRYQEQARPTPPRAAAPTQTGSGAGGAGGAGGGPDWYRAYVQGGGGPAAPPLGESRRPVRGEVITKSGQPYWSFGGGAHAGVDIQAKAGTPVRSPVSGVVVANLAAGQNPLGLSKGYGRAVAVRDDEGHVHVFGHGAPDFGYPQVGARVGVGEVISTVGSPKTKLPGEATEGEHLHWEIRGQGDYGKQIDPERWLKDRAVPQTNTPRVALTSSPGATGGGPDWYRQYRAQGGS